MEIDIFSCFQNVDIGDCYFRLALDYSISMVIPILKTVYHNLNLYQRKI